MNKEALKAALVHFRKFADELERAYLSPTDLEEVSPETKPAPPILEEVPLARIRTFLVSEVAQAIRIGKKEEARALLTAIGAKNVSQIPDEKVLEVRAAILELING
jgi:hypothetical protein